MGFSKGEIKVDLQTAKQQLAHLGKAIAGMMAEELEVKKGLLQPKEAYIQKKTEEFIEATTKELLIREKRLNRAGELLKDAFALLLSPVKEEIGKEISKSFDLTVTETKEETFQSILGLSDKTLLWMYSIGHQLYTDCKYEDALCIFQMLTTLNPLVADYFIAQGLCERSLQRNLEALQSFALASIMNPNQLISRYNSAEIYLELNQVEDAKLEFEVLEELVEAQKLVELKPALEVARKKIYFHNVK